MVGAGQTTEPTPATESFLDEAKSLSCVHCGLCLGACPTYLETGNENDSPRGRIYLMRAVQEGRLPLASAAVRHLDLCLGCQACEEACPSGVPYGELLESTREHIRNHYDRGWGEARWKRWMIDWLFPYPERLELALAPARWLKHLGMDRVLPQRWRDMLALIPDGTAQAQLPLVAFADTDQPKGRVGFVTGCVMPVMFSPTHLASIRLLNRAGYDVLIPPGQGCCGALDAHGGNLMRARQFARGMMDRFGGTGVEAVIINAAGCGSTLKHYGHLLKDDERWADRARQFSGQVKDLTEWLAGKEMDWLQAPKGLPDAVTYHDACHLAHPQGITQAPRELVRRVAGSRYVELPEADVCCGSAGTYNLTEPEMAARLQDRKIQNIRATGATLVVTSNPGCILQIQAGLAAKHHGEIEVMHIADFLAKFGLPEIPPTVPAKAGLEHGRSVTHG